MPSVGREAAQSLGELLRAPGVARHGGEYDRDHLSTVSQNKPAVPHFSLRPAEQMFASEEEFAAFKDAVREPTSIKLDDFVDATFTVDDIMRAVVEVHSQSLSSESPETPSTSGAAK